MMNNDQLQKQIDASPESGTVLSRIVTRTADNREAVEELFLTVLARRPSEKDTQIALDHLSASENRAVGFEDLLWGLLNSAEFTTKR